MRFRSVLFVLLPVIILAACRKKDDPVTPATTGSMNMEFTNVVGGRPMNLGTSWYITPLGDSFQITTYNYYISNIVLTTQDGHSFAEPESHHLVQQSDPATWKFKINGLPAGDYTAINFLIGVDSAHNVSGAQTGDLEPGRGMIWDWNTGYIMAKMEGHSPKSPNANGNFYYHIAGFRSGESVLKNVSLSFPEAATISLNAGTPGVHLFSDAAQWFTSPVDMNIATINNVQETGRNAQMIATNYADMFVVDHIDH